jgi:hypothetical protein
MGCPIRVCEDPMTMFCISFKLPRIFSATIIVIFTRPTDDIVDELSLVPFAIGIAIHALAMLETSLELSLIHIAVRKLIPASTVLFIIFPFSFIEITVVWK